MVSVILLLLFGLQSVEAKFTPIHSSDIRAAATSLRLDAPLEPQLSVSPGNSAGQSRHGGTGGRNLVEVLETKTHDSLVRGYIWGSDLSGSLQGAGGTGGLVAVVDATGGTHFAVMDGSGNVVGLVDASSGLRSATYEYDPFGQIIRKTGSAADLNPFRFSTRYADVESGMVYYGYRYYNPSTGRWLNRDPIGELGGVNLYALVGNDPANYVDVLGLEVGDWWDPRTYSSSYSKSSGQSLLDAMAQDHGYANYEDAVLDLGIGNEMFTSGGWAEEYIEAGAGYTTIASYAYLEGVLARVPGVSSDTLKSARMCEIKAGEKTFTGGCFPHGTIVATQTGGKEIQNVLPGEVVWSYDTESGEWEVREVLQTFEHLYDGDIITIYCGDAKVEASGNHPFWVVAGKALDSRPEPFDVPEPERGTIDWGRWVEARSLQVGDQLLAKSGESIWVDRIAVRYDRLPVYNITVQGNHTYAVADLGFLVHNKAGQTKPIPRRRGLWKLTPEGADKIMKHREFGTFYRSRSDGTWWVADNAGHGGSAFKVYRETGDGLVWRADADEFGDFIAGKHKGPTGQFISWKELTGK